MKILATTLIITSALFSSTYAKSKDSKRRPPKEAIMACESKDEGASCSFRGRRGEVNGTCVKKKSSKPAACKPIKK